MKSCLVRVLAECTSMVSPPLVCKVSPECLTVFSDCGCIHGVQPDPAVYIIPPGCPEEQQTLRRATADSPA